MDNVRRGMAPYEAAGVKQVGEVAPYELMKLRLLNGSHQAMSYFGYLAGYRLVPEAAPDPLFRRLLAGYMDQEAAPHLAPGPGVDPEEDKQTLIEPFPNPHISDHNPRRCAFSSDPITQLQL